MRSLVRKTKTLHGIGIHSGLPAWIEILPAALPGIYFKDSSLQHTVASRVENVTSSRFQTVLGDRFRTVEHVLSALYSLGISSVQIVVGGESGEIPIMDGSALPFVKLIQESELQPLWPQPKFLYIQKEIRFENPADGSWGVLSPSHDPLFTIEATIDFNGNQEHWLYKHDWDNPVNYETEVAPARTFVYDNDVPKLKSLNLGLGGSENNTVVYDSQSHQAISSGGARFPNERVRHKVLDILGDFSLCGAPIVGKFTCLKPGHSNNIKLVSKINSFCQPTKVQI